MTVSELRKFILCLVSKYGLPGALFTYLLVVTLTIKISPAAFASLK